MPSTNGPTTNLTWNELACKDGSGYPQEYVRDGRVYRLAQVFENIRALSGEKSINIHSAYRTPEWNKKVGGVTNSQHVLGMALDLHHTKMDNHFFGALLLDNYKALGLRGLGFYKEFIHIDIRSGGLVVWDGS